MGDDFGANTSLPSFRRFSDSNLLDARETCNRLHDLVSTNNHKNDKLNELSQIDCKNNNVEGTEDGDEIDDEWFSKLANSKDLLRAYGTSSPILYGFNCGEPPLLWEEDLDFKEKTMRTLRVGLKKIWRRGSATITAEDPTYKVAYLGNVLTGWAKGEGCIDKPLNTLWKNYNSSTKPEVQMKITVKQSGLEAETKDHGLIEYWSNRITYCCVPSGLSRVFCWVYRHQGRKMKQELRCHAVLCSKESVATRMAATLRLRLTQALVEFKRDKLLRQNARLSLANSVYDNPSLPRRKILLSTGSHNYKPPLERSKSAPKLMSIEESLEEEESTPKAKRKFSDEQEEEAVEGMEKGKQKKSNLEEKCEYKLANINFVRKLCSSIENLVESTSNYSKKLLTERKYSKDFCLAVKKPEESILKKWNGEQEGGEPCKKSRAKKFVSFEGSPIEGPELARCTEYKTLNEEEAKDWKTSPEGVSEAKDQESDEGSNSLQSVSSCCSSDVSSLVTNVSDRSVELTYRIEDDAIQGWEDYSGTRETSRERLHEYLSGYDEALLQETDKVVLHPTGEDDGGGSPEEGGSLSEEDVASDESGYVELAENLEKRLTLDSKEKDLPYHKIIKSTMLRPGRTKPSCLHV